MYFTTFYTDLNSKIWVNLLVYSLKNKQEATSNML